MFRIAATAVPAPHGTTKQRLPRGKIKIDAMQNDTGKVLKITITARRSELPAYGRRTRLIRYPAIFLLLAGCVYFALTGGFLRYAVTFPLWNHAEGEVIGLIRNADSNPIVRFKAADGSLQHFDENYFLLCAGRYSFCFARRFTTGEKVPVVYDPLAPQRAYINDWALKENILQRLICLSLVPLLLMCL